MNSLGCFKDKDKLKQDLLKAEHNTGEKNNMPANNKDYNERLAFHRKSDILPSSWPEEKKTVLWRWHRGHGESALRLFGPTKETNWPLQDERSVLQPA